MKNTLSTDKCSNEMNNTETPWLQTPLTNLNQKDREEIIGNKELSDKVIESAQNLLKDQFPEINGFQSTLFKQNLKHFTNVDENMVQILHRGDINSGHWFTVSTVNCKKGTIDWFDSLYSDLDKVSKQQICAIMKPEGKNLVFQKCPVQNQVGVQIVDYSP